jgi:hypothetical protein
MRTLLLVCVTLLVAQAYQTDHPGQDNRAHAASHKETAAKKEFSYRKTDALLVARRQDTQEAYPGQSKHGKPPAGWFCQPPAKGVAKEHACSCKPMSQASREDPQCCATEVTEDVFCTVFCHKDHCLCPTVCAKHTK